MTKTIAYYNENAEDFFKRTVGTDMSYAQEKFLSFLPPRCSVLDLGCGSGRGQIFSEAWI